MKHDARGETNERRQGNLDRGGDHLCMHLLTDDLDRGEFMIFYENRCVDCGLPCLGSTCNLTNAPVYYCDNCGEEISGDEKLIRFQKSSGLDDSWMCEECFNKVIDSLTFTIKVSTLLSSL